MKEKDLILAISSASEYLGSKTRHGCFADRTERDALNYLIGFLREAHPAVSDALQKLADTCTEVRVAAKKELNEQYGPLDRHSPVFDAQLSKEVTATGQQVLSRLVEASECKKGDTP